MTRNKAVETILNQQPTDDWAAFMDEEAARDYALECAMEFVLEGRL